MNSLQQLLIIPKEITFANIALNNTSSSSFMVKNTTNQFQNLKFVNFSQNKYKIEPESFQLQSQEEQLIKIKTTIDKNYIHTQDDYIQIIGDQIDQKIKISVLKYKSSDQKSQYSSNIEEEESQSQPLQLNSTNFKKNLVQDQDKDILIQELNIEKDERDEIIMQQEQIIKDQQITIENLKKELEITNEFENDKQNIYEEVQNLEDLIKNYKQEIEIQQNEFNELKNKLQKQINDNLLQQNKIQELQQQISELNFELEKKQEKKEFKQQDNLLSEIMELKEKLLQEEYNCAQLENKIDQIQQNNLKDIQQREENFKIQIEKYEELQKENLQNLVSLNNQQEEFKKLENQYQNCQKELQEQFNENQKNLDMITTLQSNKGILKQQLDSQLEKNNLQDKNNSITRNKSIREIKYVDQSIKQNEDTNQLKQQNQNIQQSLEIQQKDNMLLKMDIENLKQQYDREIIETNQQNQELRKIVQEQEIQIKQYQSKLNFEEKIQQNHQQEKEKLYQQLNQLKRENQQLSILKPNQNKIQQIQRQYAQSSDQKEIRYKQNSQFRDQSQTFNLEKKFSTQSLQNDSNLKQEIQDLYKEKIRTDQRFQEYIEQSKANNQMQQKKEQILTDQINILKKQVEKLKKRNKKLKSKLNVSISDIKVSSVSESIIPSNQEIKKDDDISQNQQFSQLKQQDKSEIKFEQMYSPEKDQLISTLRQQINKYESDLQLKEQQINHIIQEKSLMKIENRHIIDNQLQNEITQLKDTVQKMKEEKRKFQKDMQLKEDQLVDNKLLIDDQLKQIKKLEKNSKEEIEKYEQQIQEKTEKINQNLLELKTFQNIQIETQKQIEKMHQELTKNQSDNRLQRTEINQLENEIKNLQFEISKLQKNLSQEQIQNDQKLKEIQEEKGKNELVIQFLKDQMMDQQRIYQEMYNLQEKKLMALQKTCSDDVVQLYSKINLQIKSINDNNPKAGKKKDEKVTVVDKKYVQQQFDEYFGHLQVNTGNAILITQLKEQIQKLNKEKNDLIQRITKLMEQQDGESTKTDAKSKNVQKKDGKQLHFLLQKSQSKKNDKSANLLLQNEIPIKSERSDKDQQMSQVATLEAQLITVRAQLGVYQDEATFYKQQKQQLEQEVHEYKKKSKIFQEESQNLEIKCQNLQKQIKQTSKSSEKINQNIQFESAINIQESFKDLQEQQSFQEIPNPITPQVANFVPLSQDFRQKQDFQFMLKEKEIFIAELQSELKAKRETIQNMKISLEKLTEINNNLKEQVSKFKSDGNQPDLQSNLHLKLIEKEKIINQLREQIMITPQKSFQNSPIRQHDQFYKLEKEIDYKNQALEDYKDKLDCALQEIDDLKIALKKKKKTDEKFYNNDDLFEKLKQIIIKIHRECLLKLQGRKTFNMTLKNNSFSIDTTPSKNFKLGDNESFYQKINEFDTLLSDFKEENVKYIVEIFIKLIDAISAQDLKNY